MTFQTTDMALSFRYGLILVRVSSAVERNSKLTPGNLTIISITMTMNAMTPSCTDGT